MVDNTENQIGMFVESPHGTLKPKTLVEQPPATPVPAPVLVIDAEKSEQVANDAIKVAEDHADDGWMVEAIAAVRSVASYGGEFTSDDVWASGLKKPRQPSALGAAIRAVAKDGSIVFTGYMKSAQVSRHRAPTAVWKKA